MTEAQTQIKNDKVSNFSETRKDVVKGKKKRVYLKHQSGMMNYQAFL